jgi:hypothetical protein
VTAYAGRSSAEMQYSYLAILSLNGYSTFKGRLDKYATRLLPYLFTSADRLHPVRLLVLCQRWELVCLSVFCLVPREVNLFATLNSAKC